MKKNFIFGFAMAHLLCEEFDPEKMAGGVDNFGKGEAALMAEAKAELAKEENDRKKEEIKKQVSIDSYNQERSAIEVRHQKAVTAAETTSLKAKTAENERFSKEGGDVRAHRETLEKIEEIRCKEINAADSAYSAAVQTLRMKNPQGYNGSRRW